MEFLSSVILSGIAWDGIKSIGSLSVEFLKTKLQGWIIDDEQCEMICKKINSYPEPHKLSNKFLEVAIEEDRELLSIMREIKKQVGFNQNNLGSSFSQSPIVNGSNNIITYNIPHDREQGVRNGITNRASLRVELEYLLAENRQIFMMYGPTEKNKQELFSEKHEIWREMARNTIIPNNKKIVSILEENKALFNPNELDILVQFKLHAQGFENNQCRVERRAEYPQFPEAMNSILK